MSNIPSRPNAESGELDFTKIYYALLERKWLVLGCLVGTILLGLLYIIKTPKTYSATTVVQVETSESKFVKIEDISTQDLKQAEILKTIETNLQGSAVLLSIIESLKLTPTQLGLNPRPEMPYTDNELVTALDKLVTVKLVRGTRLINITADNTDPVLAQKISDDVITEYTKQNTAQRIGLSGEANKFLLEEADRLKQQVTIAEQQAQSFKDAHPGVALEDSQSFIDQKILAVSDKLNGAKENRFKTESDYSQVRGLLTGAVLDESKIGQLLTIGSVNTDPAVLQLEKSVADEEANIQNLSQRYKPKHPKFVQEQAQLAGLNAALARAVVKAAESVGTSLEAARQTEAKFEETLKALEQSKLDNDKLAIPYNAIMREVDANRQLFESVRMRLKETEVTRDVETNDIRIVTPALLPDKPSKPKVVLVLIASVFGGVLLGACVTFAFSATDNSFKTVDEAEQALSLPVLATVPLAEIDSQSKGLLILREPQGAVAEAFRTLRTSMSLQGSESKNTFLFTSAVPGEGKSFCSINFAVSLAQLGLRTLLIDGDLRLPTVGKILFGQEPDRGVTAVLTEKIPLEEAAHTTDVPNLFVLAAGSRAQNPAELLAGSAFKDLVREATGKFDRVVIDSAPVHAVSDTLLLIKHVQSVCLVIHVGKTPVKVVQRASHLLEHAGTKPVGIVLNRMSQRNQGYYYYYSAGEYGKGVYGTNETTS